MRLYDDIIIEVAKRLNLEESFVRNVLNQFFRSIKKRLQNPQNYFHSSLGMNGWFYFKIDQDKLENSIIKISNWVKKTNIESNTLSYFKQILNKRNEYSQREKKS